MLYDGACPLCQREIAWYRELPASCPVAWLDVNDAQALSVDDATRSRYLSRFHVRRADGETLSGAAAFVALWLTLPGWRWLGRMGRLPGVTPLLELMYRGFLPLRPHLQRVAHALATPHIPAALVADLRSDHAGETGAVHIYRGVLALARDPGLRAFATHHLATEQRHLDQVAAVLPAWRRSWCLPAWRVAGFLTGALPALFGPRAVYATVHAVETFVDRHYQQQIDRLDGLERTASPRPGAGTGTGEGADRWADLRALLVACQQDERQHRDEALALQAGPVGVLTRAWCALVGTGSAAAVHLARRL